MQRNEQIEFLEEYKKHISQGFGQYQPEVKEQCAKIDTWITALRAATIPQTGGYVTHDQAFKNAATVAEPSYTDSTSQLHVGGSSFESWYAGYAKKLTGNPKQTARDAYAAGMGDPLVMAREAAQQQAEPVGDKFRLVPVAPDCYTLSLIPGNTAESAKKLYQHIVESASAHASNSPVKAWSCNSETNGSGLCKSWCRDPIICPASMGNWQQAEPVGDERAEFEVWAQSKNMHLAKGNCGWYISAPTHEAWQGWQARAAQSDQQAGVAEGWKLVPIEPTPTQTRAGQLGVTTTCANAIYAAMLAAAPTTAAQGGDSHE